MSLADVFILIGYFGFVAAVICIYVGAIAFVIRFFLQCLGVLSVERPDLEGEVKDLRKQVECLKRRW